MNNDKADKGKTANDKTLQSQRQIQVEQDAKDAKDVRDVHAGKAGRAAKKAVQAGARKQLVKLPAQHLANPGLESELAISPRFQAPNYVASGRLAGMAAPITGADSGIGRARHRSHAQSSSGHRGWQAGGAIAAIWARGNRVAVDSASKLIDAPQRANQ